MEVDVIIVGGGLAGLSAADSLKNHDASLRIIVLEANDQVGGRIQSEKINDCFYDVGAQWILPEHKALLQVITTQKTIFFVKSDHIFSHYFVRSLINLVSSQLFHQVQDGNPWKKIRD